MFLHADLRRPQFFYVLASKTWTRLREKGGDNSPTLTRLETGMLFEKKTMRTTKRIETKSWRGGERGKKK